MGLTIKRATGKHTYADAHVHVKKQKERHWEIRTKEKIRMLTELLATNTATKKIDIPKPWTVFSL